jgi:high-affinity iron transporter
MRRFIPILLILLSPVFLCAVDYEDWTKQIKGRFDQSVKLYQEGKQDEAQQMAQSAYFDLFEDLEGPIRINISSKKAWDMERKFVKIRKLVKEGAPLAEIEAAIASLNADMDEVLPKIQSGAVLIAQTSDDAAGLDARWQSLYDLLASKFDDSVAAFINGDKAKAKELIRSAQFDEYRNGQIEIAVRTHVSQSRDGRIQNEMRRIIMGIDALDDPSALQKDLAKLSDDIYEALVALPSEAAEIAISGAKVAESKRDFYVTLENLKTEGAKALTLYASGEAKSAASAIQNAYFDVFEASGMEVRIGAIDVSLKLEIEGTFSEIAAIMNKGADETQVKNALEKLYAQVERGASKLSGGESPWQLFIYALSIILREGVEALIVVAAVIAYLVKSGNNDKLNIVYSSLWTAIALSFATAFVMNYLFNASGESRELLEGITMLVAVLLLFYVGFWLLSNAHSKKWARYISEQVKDSLSGGSAKALWFTVFLAVYREGAETVLFYQAIIFDANGATGYGAIGAGLAIGSALLVVLFFALKAGAVKIPIKPFFMITSAIIFYMSVTFAGKGVMELVEGKILEPTILAGFPTVTWLGLYPYIETLTPQIVLLLGAIVGGVLIKTRANKAAV